MRRSIPVLTAGFATYGALIVGLSSLVSIGLGVLWVTGGVVGAEFALAVGLSAGVSVLFGGPFLLTAWGLHTRRAAARIPALVLGVLVVGNAPLGTLLGGYTLYTLLDAEGVDALNA